MRTKVPGKHSIESHFPKDRKCEICRRAKITRAPCRKRAGEAIPRANFGDLITADHKVLIEGCESRIDHRYAVVVQDSATQWIQSYSCKSREQKTACRNSWGRRGNKKSFTLTIPWNFAKPVRTCPGIIVRRHLPVQRQVGLLRERHAG